MKKFLLSALCGIVLTGSSAAVFAGDLYTGFRGSKIYPNNTPAYWANVGDAMTKNFTTSSTKPVPAAVWITSFYFLGQAIRLLLDDELEPGAHRLTVHCSELPAGVYFYRLTIDGFAETKAMTLIR
jgi:hypothetical protein